MNGDTDLYRSTESHGFRQEHWKTKSPIKVTGTLHLFIFFPKPKNFGEKSIRVAAFLIGLVQKNIMEHFFCCHVTKMEHDFDITIFSLGYDLVTSVS